MLQPSLFLILFANLIYGEVHNIKIERGVPYQEIKNAGYKSQPQPYGTTEQWNLEVESGSTIKVLCDDIRMGQHGPFTPECEHVYLSFDEGSGERKVCGPNEARTVHTSKGSKLTVKIVSKDGSGLIHCTAFNTKEPEPEVVDLTKNQVVALETPESPIPFWDHVWILKSPPNTRISLQCDVSFSNYDPCYKDVLTIDTGSEVKEFCGGKTFTEFTVSNNGKVRMQLNEFGDMRSRCAVQAVTGPHANEFLNVVSEEEDSSEFGLTSGSRKTSCNCGRRYVASSPARIINGNETMENEYPWMVLLNIYKEIGDGRWSMSYCGASIITRRHVLTAAHCVVSQRTVARPDGVIMRFAEHHSGIGSGKEVEIRAEQIFVHENYLKRGSHDIALLFTRENIPFSDIIGPVCLTREILPLYNKRIKIMGWGQTELGRGSDVLLKAKGTVINRVLCGKVPDFEICTYGKPSTTCYGDSGGPLLWYDKEINRYTQVALVSRGTHPICNAGVGLHTHVPSFIDWIEDIIQRTDPGATICQKV